MRREGKLLREIQKETAKGESESVKKKKQWPAGEKERVKGGGRERYIRNKIKVKSSVVV